MSKSNASLVYRDPLTAVGVRLGGAESFAFHLHEAGCMKLVGNWDFAGVRSPFWRLYWAARRGAWIDCEGKRHALEPNRVLLVPAHTLFSTHSPARPVVHFWIHFSLYPDLTALGGGPIRVPCGTDLARRVASLARRTAREKSPSGRELYHLCGSLLHQVFADPAVAAHPPRLPPRLLAVLDDVETSLAQPPTIRELARRAGMSRGGFLRWFRERMEISPARYVAGRRIDHACRLLKFTSATIEEISEKLGFANRNHFARVFKRRLGLGPAAFRKS